MGYREPTNPRNRALASSHVQLGIPRDSPGMQARSISTFARTQAEIDEQTHSQEQMMYKKVCHVPDVYKYLRCYPQ